MTENQLTIAKGKKADFENRLREKTKKCSSTMADMAELSELRQKIDDTVKDIDAILVYVPTELDFNRGLQINADFLHDLDQLRSGANRRRFSNYVLLEKHNADLERAAQDADKVVDAEFQEVDADTEGPPKIETQSASSAGTSPVIAASPSIVPTEGQESNDVERQNRSEPAQ